jgi:hypothetical protein
MWTYPFVFSHLHTLELESVPDTQDANTGTEYVNFILHPPENIRVLHIEFSAPNQYLAQNIFAMLKAAPASSTGNHLDELHFKCISYDVLDDMTELLHSPSMVNIVHKTCQHVSCESPHY